MTVIKAHHVYDDDEPERIIASIHPASKKMVKLVRRADKDNFDGRSNWVWVRLPNGDLILGIYPQGDTYEACERDAQYPYQPE